MLPASYETKQALYAKDYASLLQLLLFLMGYAYELAKVMHLF